MYLLLRRETPVSALSSSVGNRTQLYRLLAASVLVVAIYDSLAAFCYLVSFWTITSKEFFRLDVNLITKCNPL